MVYTLPSTLLQVNTLPCGQAACHYAGVQRWPVFPCAGKRPLTPRGFYNATTDEAQIQHWWRRWPEAGIGLPAGEITGIVVLDVDPRHGGWDALERLQRQLEPLPATCTTRTGGGGLHLWFAYPREGGVRLKNATNLGGFTGIDLRGSGGYIVAPPSRHASGKRYQWLRAGALAPLPGFLIELCCPVPPPPTCHIAPFSSPHEKSWHGCSPADGSYWLRQAVQKAMPGTRNTTGFWLACQLRDSGVGFLAATSQMRQYAALVGQRGGELYTEREALRSLASAYRAPARAPARSMTVSPVNVT
jgi:Bifunctional DNA primase/polymerase, N-terminal